MTYAVHLSNDLLIRSIDAEVSTELSVDERLYAERHLASCHVCRRRRQEWAESLDLVEAGIASLVVPVPANSRTRLAAALKGAPVRPQNREGAGRRFGMNIPVLTRRPVKPLWWQLTAAASLACAILAGLASRHSSGVQALRPETSVTTASTDGDYLPLPYSSAALSPAEAQVVRVEMPVSSLREAGIFVPSTDEEYVDADIILGLDGQPQGIRLVTQEDGRVLN